MRLIAILGLMALLVPIAAMSQGPVAFWPFDEQSGTACADSSGNGLDGAAYGAAIVGGVVRNARYFDGKSNYVHVPDNELLRITNAITIMLWAKFDASDGEGFIVNKRLHNDVNCAINYDIKVGFSPGASYLAFQYGSGCATGSNYALLNVPNLGDGSWHHLAISLQYGEPASAIWMIDGAVVPGSWTRWDGTPGGGTELPPTSTDPLQIGRQLSSSPGYFRGMVDEMRIYDRALAPEEIRSFYINESGGLIAWWKLDEETPYRVFDSSVHGLHGLAKGTQVIDGVRHRAREFNGSTDYIEIPENDLLDVSDEITIMLWARIATLGREGFLVSKRLSDPVNCSINYGIKSWATSQYNYLAFQYGDGCSTGCSYALTNVPALSDGGWHHLAFTYKFGDPESAKWLIDGTETPGVWKYWDGSAGGGTEIPSTNDLPLQIGRQLSSSPGYFTGALDEVMIYGRALSTEEIESFYEARSLDKKILVYTTRGSGGGCGVRRFDYNEGLPLHLGLDGYEVVTEDRESMPELNGSILSVYDQLWLVSTESGAILSTAEVQAIHDFHASGKGIMVICDSGSYDGPANQISAPWGVVIGNQVNHCGGEIGCEVQTAAFAVHSIWTQVGSIQANLNEGHITASYPALVIASHNGYSMAAVYDDGIARVAWDATYYRFTDEGCHPDLSIAAFDNTRYARNIARWLDYREAPADARPAPEAGRIVLQQNVPNPFNPSTLIRYDVLRASSVRLEIFDAAGRRVRTLVDGGHQPGSYSVLWDGTNERGARARSGVYFCRLSAGSEQVSRKLVLIR